MIENQIKDEFFTKDELYFLETYLNSASPTGNEKENQDRWSTHVKSISPKVKVHSDPYYNYWATLNFNQPKSVIIEAHADEIAWSVNTILSNGKLNVIRQGGSDVDIAPSQKVRVLGTKGEIPGFFSFAAIHVRDKEVKPKLHTLEVDCGFSSKEEAIEAGIENGTQIIFDQNCYVLNGKWLVGRALDNRIGGFMISKVLRMVIENEVKLEFNLIVANCSQEEIGLFGARRFAQNIIRDNNIHAAIATDVTHDTSETNYEKLKNGDVVCNGGPVLGTGPLIQKDLLKHIREVAKEKDVKYQLNALDRSTGTDTDMFSLNGIPAALISLPLRNMHTTNEMISIEDMKSTINLIYNSLVSMKWRN